MVTIPFALMLTRYIAINFSMKKEDNANVKVIKEKPTVSAEVSLISCTVNLYIRQYKDAFLYLSHCTISVKLKSIPT